MQAAEDFHADQPAPFTGRAEPPAHVQADNDDAIVMAFRALPDFIYRAVMGYRLHQRKAEIRFSSAMTRRRAAELSPKATPTPRDAEVRMAQARDLRSKAARLRADDAKGNRAEIKKLETDAILAEREAALIVREAADAEWARKAGEEGDALAKARGEEVVTGREGKRIMTRNGIAQAYGARYMTPTLPKMSEEHLHEAAKLYRACACVMGGMTTPSKGEGGYNAKGPQARLAEAGDTLRTLRIGLTDFQVEVLDHVCGFDMRAREVALVLRKGFPAVRVALAEGLSMAVINLRAARALRQKQGDEMSLGEQLRVKHAAIMAAERAA